MKKYILPSIGLIIALSGIIIGSYATTLLPERADRLETELQTLGQTISAKTTARDQLQTELDQAKARHTAVRCELAHLKLADKKPVSPDSMEICLGKSSGASSESPLLKLP